MRVLILVGIPSSGKSTYCAELMKKEPGKWKRINNDALRAAIDFSVWSSENEKLIKNLREHILKESLMKGYNVVIDNLNLGKDIGMIFASKLASLILMQSCRKSLFILS